MITITNISGRSLSIDTEIDEGENLRLSLAPAASANLDDITVDEAEANAQLQSLVASGDIRVTFSPPTMEQRTFTLVAGAGGAADEVTPIAAFPYPATVVDAIARTTTTVTDGTVTVQSVTGAMAAGAELKTSALAAAEPGVARDARTSQVAIQRGEPVILRRSDSAIAGQITLILSRNEL